MIETIVILSFIIIFPSLFAVWAVEYINELSFLTFLKYAIKEFFKGIKYVLSRLI